MGKCKSCSSCKTKKFDPEDATNFDLLKIAKLSEVICDSIDKLLEMNGMSEEMELSAETAFAEIYSILTESEKKMGET